MLRVLRSQTGEVSFVPNRAEVSLKETLLNAYQFSAYKSLFNRCGIEEGMLTSYPVRAFVRLSPSSKKDYISLQRDALERIQDRQFATDWSSGSTARPVLRISSPSDERAEAEAVRRAFQSSGITGDDRVVFLDVGASDIYLFYGRVLAELGVRGPCFVKVSSRKELAARAIALIRPTVIISVPSVLSLCLADIAMERKALREWKLDKIVYIGEAMNSMLRTSIHKELGVSCLSFYGTTEVGSVGIECERGGGIHIPLDLMFPTLLPHDKQAIRASGPRSYEGEVAWTSLRLRDHPVVKYRVGDLVRISLRACPCGSSFPTMRFQTRMNHSLSLFGIKFSYDLLLDCIQNAVGSAANLEVRMSRGSSNRRSQFSRVTFLLPDCYRACEKHCKEEVLNIHPMADFVERGLLRLSFEFVPATYFHRRKTRRIVLNGPKG